jgi:hypothetical protein
VIDALIHAEDLVLDVAMVPARKVRVYSPRMQGNDDNLVVIDSNKQLVKRRVN